MSVQTCGNYSLDIKRLFISFAQAFFRKSDDVPFRWHPDPVTTNIIIADKFDIDLEVVEKKPAIVFSRGAFAWAQTSIAQRADPWPEKRHNVHLGPERYTDLINGQATYNCMSKNGIEAEQIANTLYVALTGYKVQFRKYGLHQIKNIQFGAEQLLKADSGIDLTVVPVTVNFYMQKYLHQMNSWSYIDVYVDGTRHRYDSSFYLLSGNIVTFYEAPIANSDVRAEYIEAITLADMDLVPSGVVDGVNRHFYLPSNVHGYPICMAILISGYATPHS